MSAEAAQQLNLDVIFPGGSQSPELMLAISDLETKMDTLHQLVQSEATRDKVVTCMEAFQEVGSLLDEVDMFFYCLRRAGDAHALQTYGAVEQLKTRYAGLHIELDFLLCALPDSEWTALLADPRMEEIAQVLTERRRRALEKGPRDQQLLANALSADGFRAWEHLRHNIVSNMEFAVEQGSQTESYKLGQVWGMLQHPDRATRAAAFAAIEQSFSRHADEIAQALNAIGGFRWALHRHRGNSTPLLESFDVNRVSEATITTMYNVLEQYAPRLVPFLQRKAELLGLDRLSHFDISAPLDGASSAVSYEDAQKIIIEQFGRFSPDMAQMAERAFTEGWVDAEDRPNKGGGGVCIPFNRHGISRVIMGYRGSTSDMMILAHELGHAYHNTVIHELPFFVQEYPMSVAETASTFAEVVVLEAALRNAQTDDEKRKLLADKMNRVLPFQLLSVYSGYLFEKQFYEERRQGIVSVERLNKMMIEAQRRAFAGALDRYHPYSWAMQGQIYVTEFPFYNYQYSFGYLFTLGIYAHAEQSGGDFATQYRNLLRDTGRLTVEEMGRQYLDADLTQPAFWQAALDRLVQDVEEFIRLTH